MIIIIQSSSQAGESEAYTELQRAFVALHVARIRPLGSGRFADGTGYVVLRQDGDAAAALTSLTRLGIGATILHPKPSPKHPA